MPNRLLTSLAILLSAHSSASAQSTSQYCSADLHLDSALNFLDLSEFVIRFSNQDPSVDFDNSGVINFLDVSAYLLAWTTCPNLTDTDGDRIPDFAESDNGIYLNLRSTGTNPLVADTDGDGIDDGDEIHGTTDGLILHDANPLRKDIFVECDWFQGEFQGRTENYRPTQEVFTRIENAFAIAPVPNPYNLPDGITLHLDFGQDSKNTGGNQLPGAPVAIQFDNGFNEYKAEHFDPRRKGYYHYAIFANRYNNDSNNSSGVAEINGDDFMVTMVNYNSTTNMANTIMHELGHNIGLRHGGNINQNNKINYNSVMNYRFQFQGIDMNADTMGDGILDFSHGFNNDVMEFAVDETIGVHDAPVDFNNNGSIDTAPYERNLNCGTGTTAPCGSNADGNCYDSTCDTLSDYNDWENINWQRLDQSFDRQPEIQIIPCQNWPGKQFE
ncbi:MAG: hypothetical protein P1U30_02020 [Phycisphaerales bacterium]|nr:hypothetical protein [Phycisphaerales bacterium]